MAGQRRSLAKSTLVVGGLIVIAALAAALSGLIPGLPPLFKGTGASADPPAPAPAPAATKAPAGPEDAAVALQQQLIQQEADLRTREAALKEQETQVADTLKQLDQQQADTNTVKRVADMYGAMPPTKAAPLIQTLSQDEAVAILRLLDQDQAGAILAGMDPARGSQLTSQLLKPPPQAQVPPPAQPQQSNP